MREFLLSPLGTYLMLGVGLVAFVATITLIASRTVSHDDDDQEAVTKPKGKIK